MKKAATYLMLMAAASGAKAQYETDITEPTSLEEFVVAAPAQKEEAPLAVRPSATTGLSKLKMEQLQIDNIKGLSGIVPNLHNPDYGSRTTSAIYIRGIGTRMDQPAVGLYVDGIPYMNKSAFDFNFSGLRKIEIARGPQGTLYGRNTMAGIINIETELPDLDQPSTTIEAGYGTFNKASLQASHYNHIGQVGVSVDGYYNSNDGYYTNRYDGSKVGEEWNAGGRMNLTYKKKRFNSLFTLSYDHTDQIGYAYAQLDSTGRNTGINYNQTCTYQRDLLTTGLKLEYAWDNLILSSASSFQFLKDNMDLDNDFTRSDIFTLDQMQKEHSLFEEVVLKTNLRDEKFRHYSFLTGISAFSRKLNLDVPVTMQQQGVSDLIEDNVNNVEVLDSMGFTLDIRNKTLPIGTNIDTKSSGAAIFHQSTFNANEKFSFELGIRADYEKASIDYKSGLDTRYTFDPVIIEEQHVPTFLLGTAEQNFVEILPKLTAKYQWEKGKHSKLVYATIARGYKSGGFNTQMMSDILQYQMQKDLKEDLFYHIPPEIDVATSTMYPILMGMKEIDVKEVLGYKPEYSWNYEVGTKLNFEKFSAEASVFFIDCTDQQVTVFSELTGLGRMMANAGHTQSCGVELSLAYRPTEWLTLQGNYGYTHAEFKDYQANDTTNFKGNRVPYAPEQTYMLGVGFNKNIKKVGRVFANIDFSGAANTYWDDENTIKEAAYGLLNGNLGINFSGWSWLTLTLWGKNLTDKEYNTFYFESMDNKFVQKGKPLQAGVKIKIRL